MERHGDTRHKFESLPSDDEGEGKGEGESEGEGEGEGVGGGDQEQRGPDNGARRAEAGPHGRGGTSSNGVVWLRWFVVSSAVASTAFVVANGVPFFLPLVSTFSNTKPQNPKLNPNKSRP